MSNLPVSKPTDDYAVMEAVIAGGDLSKLTAQERTKWYLMRCEAAGLDPKTQPFQYILLSGKLTLYATKTATDQLCQQRSITTQITNRERGEGLYIVTCRASTPDGRFTEEIGAVAIDGLKGEPLANALMKASTKSKRRAVLSLCGLGALDETEVDTIDGAKAVPLEQAQAPQIMVSAPSSQESTADLWARCKDMMTHAMPELAGLKNQHFVQGLKTLLPEERQAQLKGQGQGEGGYKPTREDVLAGIAALEVMLLGDEREPDPFADGETIDGETVDA